MNRFSEYERRRDNLIASGIPTPDAQQAAGMGMVIDSLFPAPKPHFAVSKRERTTRHDRRADRQAIIERDGEDCWLCGEPMLHQDRTIEHLEPVFMGGSNDLDNKVLCHLGCNRYLGQLSREDKEKLRGGRQIEREELA